MLNPAKRYFVNEGDIIYLVDYLLMYPCNTYLHPSHAFMHQRLKTYIESENENAEGKGKISIYSFPIKHMTHEYICKNFSKIVFRKENIARCSDCIDKYSVLTESQVTSQDFCTPENVTKIAPQIAYMIRKYASKMETDKFDPQEAKSVFYDRTNEIRIRDAVAPYMQQNRERWELDYSALWPPDLSFHRGEFPKNYIRDVTLPQLRDALKRSGINKPQELARIIDQRYPKLLTDHKMGKLVRPEEAPKILYESVRQYGRIVRGKRKKKTS